MYKINPITEDGHQYMIVDSFGKGIIHREDGPAVIYFNGKLEYWLNGNNITEGVNEWIKDNNIPDYKLWTKSHKVLFKLTFG